MSRYQKNNTTLDELMLSTVSDTFENMAFMEVERAGEKDGHYSNEDSNLSSLLVNDPVQGEFILSLPKTLNRKIVENLYGISGEKQDEQLMMDILSEVLNTITGRFMSEIMDSEQTLEMGLPESGTCECPKIDTPSLQWNYFVEGETFSLIAVGESLLKFLQKKNDPVNNSV